MYKRYASLYFVMGIDANENELITLEVIHHYVEVLDKYFGNVCELDLIFNFHKARLAGCMYETCKSGGSLCACMQAYWMLDELLIAGELQEPSKKVRWGLLEQQQPSLRPCETSRVRAGHLEGHRGAGQAHRGGEAGHCGDCFGNERILTGLMLAGSYTAWLATLAAHVALTASGILCSIGLDWELRCIVTWTAIAQIYPYQWFKIGFTACSCPAATATRHTLRLVQARQPAACAAARTGHVPGVHTSQEGAQVRMR